MYATHVGRHILDLYNQRHQSALTPRQFFDEVFFPLFFDDERYLMWVNNSKFDQKYKQRKKRPLNAAVRRLALEEFHADAATLTEPHGHLFLGGIVRELTDPTASQVTDLAVPTDADQVYCSWFGAAAGIGVRSGLSLLVDEDDVLEALIEGWTHYRAFMQQTPGLRPHQIDTWNGHWIQHRFSRQYDPADPIAPGHIQVEFKSGAQELATIDWSHAIFALARGLSGRPVMAYVYTFGQMNTTVGFIHLELQAVQRLWEWHRKLFGSPAGLDPSRLAGLYETEFGFYRACEHGAIGLRALEPRKLRDYIPSRPGRSSAKLLKPARSEKERTTHTFYQTWIIAMLNNADLIELAQSTAEVLKRHSVSDERGKMAGRRRVDAVLNASGVRPLIDALTDIVKEDGEVAAQIDALVKEIIRMPRSDVPLVLTLIRFKYAVESATADA
ncbi:MAG: hypothetical protein ACREL7_15965 [Longimicrobiales bacterium]